MKEEVVILNGEPKSVYKNGKDCKGGFTEYVEKEWHSPQPILREPHYVAIHVNGTDLIEAIIEIDSKSELEKGTVRNAGKVIHVHIPIRFGKNKLRGINYTTFRKLITHESTDDL